MSMLSNWPEWTRLYWLLCIPVSLLLLFALYRTHKNQHNWHTLLPKAFHAVLLNQHNPRHPSLRYWLLGCAWLFTLLALLGPSWHTATESPTTERHFAPLVIVIQLTPDMLANDLPPSRLQHVQDKIMRLLEQRQTAFTALVVYAGSAHTLVPLSNDLLTSKNLLQALQPDLMPEPGQRADVAIQRAIELLQHGAQGSGQILLISTGVSVSEQNAIKQLLQKQTLQFKIMGVGSTAGAPIIGSTQGHFVTDSTGAIVLSRLNETSLQLLSQYSNSPYSQISSDDSDLHALDLLTLTESNFTTTPAGQKKRQHDQGYWFIFPIVLLAAIFARRGSLLVLLVCLLPMQVFAFSLDDLWLRPDQQGAKLLQQQPTLAAERFTDLQWRATALYLAGDYPAAAELFALFDSPAAHYNRGNALALSGLLPEAIQAYQLALSQAPDMLAAQYNLAFVEEHLAAVQAQTVAEPITPPAEITDSSVSSASAATASGTAVAPEAHNDQDGQTEAATTDSAPTSAMAQAEEQPTQQWSEEHDPALSAEQPLHFESWLEQIPDNPGELLKRKFWYEHTMQEIQP